LGNIDSVINEPFELKYNNRTDFGLSIGLGKNFELKENNSIL
jgi:hypothetical protein